MSHRSQRDRERALDEALEGSAVTPTGELTDFGAEVEGARL